MLDWLDRIPNLGVPGVPGVPSQFSAGLRGTPDIARGVPGVLEHLSGTPGTPARTPAHAPNPLKHSKEHREHLEHRKKGDPAAWLAALAALDTSRPPAGIAPDLWPVILADAQWIARHHGDTAAALGWTASDLFGLSEYPGEGGLADRLNGARRIAFTSSVAHWRGEDCEGWLWRRTLTDKPLIWGALT